MNGSLWDTPQEIARKDVPVVAHEKADAFRAMFLDADIRLERTNGSKALMYPLVGDVSRRGAAGSLARQFNKTYGKGWAVVRSGTTPDGQPAIFIMRGPNYGK